MRKKVVSLLCVFLLAGNLSSFHPQTASANDDVTGIALEKEMRAMIELGIMKGYGEGVYQPRQEINRGQFAALIARALDLPEGTPSFNDVSPTATLAPDIYRASKAEIINGYSDGTFRMEKSITRAQMAMMIDNALTKYLKIPRHKAPLTFLDRAEIGSVEFQKAVSHAVYDEIVLGFSYPEGSKFLPKKTATRAEAAAFIYRMLRTWKPEYKVEAVTGTGELVEAEAEYSSYQDATSAAASSNEVITQNDKVVGMASGIVITNPPIGSALTYIYRDPNFSDDFTYLPAQQELEFVRSTEDYVEVKIAGKTGYVKHREVSLIPEQQIKGRNYYSVNSAGDLVHWIYVPSGNYYQNYVTGKAPAFLTTDTKYYSWDGVQFNHTSGSEAGTAYQYFNYLPARTTSNYSAEELDSFINQELSRIEQLYNRDSAVFKSFKDATTKSKLIGLGNYLKEAEAKYKINALMILGMAIHESNFGMSYLAQDRNNLFGMNAIDDNENLAEHFDAPERAVDALAERYLNKNYINPLGRYANGAVFGNKSRGFNVKYASDPYWGQKIAGHMYRADKTLGGKDFGKYTIGETNASNIEVRHTPEEGSGNKQFTYLNEIRPVAILETANGWCKVISDHNDYNEAYIHSQYVNELEIVK